MADYGSASEQESEQSNDCFGSDDDNSDDDRYAAMAIVATMLRSRSRRNQPRPMHNSRLTGPMRVAELLNGHDEILLGMVSMKADTFRSLCDLLRGRELLQPTRNMDVDEQLFIFLAICSQGASNRHVSYLFQRSLETTSRTFDKVLHVICSLKEEFIRPPDYTAVQPLVEEHAHKYRPWFDVSSVCGYPITSVNNNIFD